MSMEPRKPIQHLEALYKGNDLSQADASAIFSSVMQGQLDHSQLAALLISLKIKGEIPAEIAGAADAMRANAASFARPDYDFADIVEQSGNEGALGVDLELVADHPCNGSAANRMLPEREAIEVRRFFHPAKSFECRYRSNEISNLLEPYEGDSILNGSDMTIETKHRGVR